MAEVLVQLKSIVGSKTIWIYGFGVEGQSSFAFFKAHGFEVGVIDGNDSLAVEGASSVVSGDDVSSFFENCSSQDLIIRSAGISPLKPELQLALKQGATVSSQLNIFAQLCFKPVVAVTGTMGKGTTCSILQHIANAVEVKTQIGGNFGLAMLDLVAHLDNLDFVILELSSFQLMDFQGRAKIDSSVTSSDFTIGAPKTEGFEICVFLRTTSEHLDWHNDHAEYLWAKTQLTSRQSVDQVLIVNTDSPNALKMAENSQARKLGFGSALPEECLDHSLPLNSYLDSGAKFLDQDTILIQGESYQLSSGLLLGSHQRENVSAAVLASLELGISLKDALAAVKTFPGLDMRIQVVGRFDGLTFVNDSYATRPDATIAAIAACQIDPLCLILGGSEKFADFDELAQSLAQHPTLSQIVLIGATAERLKKLILKYDNKVELLDCDSLASACEQGVAHLKLVGGGTLLLSPACASFGMFKNYKDRGAQFTQWVENYISER